MNGSKKSSCGSGRVVANEGSYVWGYSTTSYGIDCHPMAIMPTAGPLMSFFKNAGYD